MSGNAWELVDLVARWIHVIAGIMWVGNSLLYNWLDRNLRPAAGATQTPKPVGNIWLLHSGGFYYVEKTLLDGAPLPQPLHWFRWQAYTTWWSGLALLLVVYYAGGRAVLEDSSIAALTHAQGVLVGAGAILCGWAIYEGANRFLAPRVPRFASLLWLAGLTVIAICLTQLLSGRAAFLHVGAMLGTIMAANVVLTIVPSQRILVASVAGGHGGDPAVSARAKRVSIHNNYFTFPVIVLMVSGHFAAVHDGSANWIMMLVLIAGGAAVRHILNARFGWSAWKPALAATMVATVALVFMLLEMPRWGAAPAPVDTGTGAGAAPVSFADARHIIDRRCGACHSAHPSDLTFGAAPVGVKFDTPEQIVAMAPRIYQRAVVLRTMPAGNKTMITSEERAILGRWFEQGAKVAP
ncbi:MAG: urate hydroxylase PuuD [Gemmatimonadota bacterium]